MPKPAEKKALYDMLYLTMCGIHGKNAEAQRVAQMDLEQVLSCSRRHNLTVVTYAALEALQDDSSILLHWREAREQALVKSILLRDEWEQLSTFCEEQGIWNMPLKGTLLKQWYPSEDMRQMSDVDVLFDKTKQEIIREWFAGRGYTAAAVGLENHDEYLKEPVLNFEMHTALFSENSSKTLASYYADIKERLVLQEGTRYSYRFREEDFYLYMTAHEYKHHSAGGIGLRSLLDKYVFLSSHSLDWVYINGELLTLGLSDFAHTEDALAQKVFAQCDGLREKELSGAEQQALAYYLFSETYGNIRNRAKNLLSGTGIDGDNKAFHIFHTLFPSRSFMAAWTNKYAPFFYRHPRFYLLPCLYRILLACRRLNK